jgi:C4-dicarboxylate-specific signal transduction histidine kinase
VNLRGNTIPRKVLSCNEKGTMRDQLKNSFLEDPHLFEAVLNQSVDGLLIIDTEGIVQYANPAAVSIFSTKTSELVGFQIGYPSSSEPVEMIIPDETEGFTIEIRSCDIQWKGQRMSLANLRDITKHKHLENQLRGTLRRLKESQGQLIQMEKMGALGILAAGIAHELNNPLMGILNYVQYVAKKLESDNKLHNILSDAEKATETCIRIINNLLTFSHFDTKDQEVYQTISFKELVDRVLGLLTYRIEKEDLSITIDVDDDFPTICTHVSKIQQILMNLISNAADAVKESKEKKIRVALRNTNNHALITVEDTGCGISPEDITQIYNPFFTTKPVGKGTGLGLSVSYGIVRDEKGEISCSSEINKGTCFTISLPNGGQPNQER